MNDSLYLKSLVDLAFCIKDLQNINKEYRKRLNKAIAYIESFEYYIPEDNKEELIKMLKGDDNEYRIFN